MNEQIDWSKAPADATHYHPRADGYVEHWIKPGFFCVTDFEHKGWQATRTDALKMAVPRPLPATKPWNGPDDGLPPVGMVCEFAGGTPCPEDPFDKDLKECMKVTIIAHFKCGGFMLAAFTFDPENPDRGRVQVEQANFGCFRPIRTAEQLAAEERERQIDKMLTAVGSIRESQIDYQLMASLYDAGARMPGEGSKS